MDIIEKYRILYNLLQGYLSLALCHQAYLQMLIKLAENARSYSSQAKENSAPVEKKKRSSSKEKKEKEHKSKDRDKEREKDRNGEVASSFNVCRTLNVRNKQQLSEISLHK